MRISDWSSDVCSSDLYLWQHVLEENGFDVTLEQLDVAPTFVGVAEGDLDLFFDTWLPITHEDYWTQYGDQVEDLGVWYDNAKLTIAVPEYVDATTIADLAGMEDTFGRSEEHTSELQSLMRISYAVFCLQKKNIIRGIRHIMTNK